MTTPKRTPMDLYNERADSNCCVRCAKVHPEGWSLRKCQNCRDRESTYRKKTRKGKRKEQERSYQRKNWFNRCLYLSRQSDLKANRTSDEPYITPQRLVTLRVLQENKCFYCDTALQVQNRKKPDGLTIERLDNSRPHSLSNVILCCHRCNCRKLSNKLTQTTFEVFYEICTRFLESQKFKAILPQLV